jgi:hypothetical protein
VNHRHTVLRTVRQMAPSLIGETYLEAVVGHRISFWKRAKRSGEVTLRRCEERVKSKEQM